MHLALLFLVSCVGAKTRYSARLVARLLQVGWDPCVLDELVDGSLSGMSGCDANVSQLLAELDELQ